MTNLRGNHIRQGLLKYLDGIVIVLIGMFDSWLQEKSYIKEEMQKEIHQQESPTVVMTAKKEVFPKDKFGN